MLGKPRASRAVGAALGANPNPVVVPCHRVIKSDGTLGGYSSLLGIERKVELLADEGVEFDVDGNIDLSGSSSQTLRKSSSSWASDGGKGDTRRRGVPTRRLHGIRTCVCTRKDRVCALAEQGTDEETGIEPPQVFVYPGLLPGRVWGGSL